MDYNIEILVKGIGSLDIQTKDSESFGIPLTFNLNDIRDISSRKASFSKTIKILGTKHNNIIFNHLYEIKGQNFDFDMTKKHECVLLVNKNPIMDGFLVLKKISKLLVGHRFEIVYEIVMFDEVKNFFDELGSKKLSDLDFSSGFTFNGFTYDVGDHEMTSQLVAENMNSTPTYTNVYAYSIVDYGYTLVGEGMVFPHTALSKGILYPQVFQRAIMDRIFYETSGFTYTSNYFNGTSHSGFFTNMVNVYNKENDFVDLQLCEYCSDGSFTTDGKSKGPTVVIPSAPPPPGLNVDIPIGMYNCNIDNLYVNSYELEDFYTSVTGLTKGIQINTEGSYKIKLRIDITEDEGASRLDLLCDLGLPSYYRIIRYSSIDQIAYQVFYISNVDIRIDEDDYSFVYESDFILVEDCDPGDVFFINIMPGTQSFEDGTGGCGEQTITIKGDGVSLELEYVRELEDVVEGQIKINEILPDMTQADFLRNHIKIANLFIWGNNENSRNLYIEPRDDFYKQLDTIENWSDKVDYNKSVTIKSLNGDISNEIKFEYQPGEDFYSQEYINKWDETYGTKILDLDNPYLKDNQEVTLDFQSYLMKDKQADMAFPKLYDGENNNQTFYDDKIGYSPMVGFIDNTIYSVYQHAGYIAGGQRNFKPRYKSWVTHAKVMGGFSYDLNYETTGETFTIDNYDPERGLYKIFWENYMNNLIDDDSRLVTYYIDFDLTDILNLDFRKRIDIDGQRYFLEKVEYDPSKKSSSKVTLLKIIDTISTGSFDTWFLLKNDLGDYITTSDGTDGLGDGGDRIIIN